MAEMIVTEIDDNAYATPLQSGNKGARTRVNQLGNNRNICPHRLSCTLWITQMVVGEYADLDIKAKASKDLTGQKDAVA